MPAPLVESHHPAPRMVSADVYERVTGLLLRNEIKPGDRINIDALAVRLAVSATPIREALARLESDGLVAKVHLRGYHATDLLSRAALADLYEFRLLIEPFAADRAAGRVTADDISALRAELASYDSVPLDPGFDSYREFSAHDERLHRLVLEIAGNDVITRSFERTHAHLHSFRLAYDSRAGHETVDEHRVIVDAIAGADSAAAARAMRVHLEHSRDRLLPLTT